MGRLKNIEWDAVAGVVAAVLALVLHLLDVVDTDVLLTVMLVILAVLLLRSLRKEGRDERAAESLAAVSEDVKDIRNGLRPPDVILIGPRALRTESERFAARARGDMTWFNVCLLMFMPQSLFDSLLRPAIENPQVTRVRFLLKPADRTAWNQHVLPKVLACRGAEKVAEPTWCDLRETVSFILAETDAGVTEAHLSFWGEPFMSHTTDRDISRYIFHVQGHSELIGRLVDLERSHSAAAHGAPTTLDVPAS